MKKLRCILIAVAAVAGLTLQAVTIPLHRLDSETRRKVERYIAVRDSLVKVVKTLEKQYEAATADLSEEVSAPADEADMIAGILKKPDSTAPAQDNKSPENNPLLEQMDKKLDKIAELEAVIDYLTLDVENSTGKQLIIVARKLINTLRPGLACRLLETPAALSYPFALNFIGVNRYGNDDLRGALEMFLRAAASGYPPALYNMAMAIDYNPDILGTKDAAEMKAQMAEIYLAHPDIVGTGTVLYEPPFDNIEYISDPLFGQNMMQMERNRKLKAVLGR